MPLVHFGFGSDFRAGNYQLQAENFLEKILKPKTLMSFNCPQFVPIINSKKARYALPNSASVTDDGSVIFHEWVASPAVSLLPNDVPMISFVDIPYTKLPKWTPAKHYGRLGIAFRDNFRKRVNVQNVSYYKFSKLEKDPLVIKLNQAINENDEQVKQILWNKVLHYRKPAKLWEEINSLFGVVRISTNGTNTNVKTLTYDRYDIGYDFESEREARIVTQQHNDVIDFYESEVLSIIVPNEEIKEYLADELTQNWELLPELKVYKLDE